MPHDAVRRDRGHGPVRIVDPLPAAEQQRESDRVGDVVGIGGRKFFVGHDRDDSRTVRTKQERASADRLTRNPPREAKARALRPGRMSAHEHWIPAGAQLFHLSKAGRRSTSREKPRAGETTRGQEARHARRIWAHSLPQVEKVPTPDAVRHGATRRTRSPAQLAGCVTIVYAIMLSITNRYPQSKRGGPKAGVSRGGGDVPSRCPESRTFAEAPARFGSSSSRSPLRVFEPSNAP